MLSLLIFIGEAVRDAFDPRKLFAGAKPGETPKPEPVPGVQAGHQTTATANPHQAAE